MIDIFFVKLNNKDYSVKVNVKKDSYDELTLRILNIDEVDRNGHTSFLKLQTIFQSDKENTFNTVKFKDLMNKIVDKMAKKYKVGNIKLKI